MSNSTLSAPKDSEDPTPAAEPISAATVMHHVTDLARELLLIRQALADLRRDDPPAAQRGVLGAQPRPPAEAPTPASPAQQNPRSRGSWTPPPSRTTRNTAEPAPRIRVDAPHFNGEDPIGWIYKLQKYFDYFYTPEDDRLHLVAVLIDKPASEWFRYYQCYNIHASWMDFLLAVKQQFAPDHFEEYSGPISELQQETTAIADHTESETLSNEVSGADANTVDFDDTWAPGHTCTTTPLMLEGTDSASASLTTGTHAKADIITDGVPSKLTLSGNHAPRSLTFPNTIADVQGHQSHLTLHVLTVHGWDVILRIHWLQTLSAMYQDYPKLTLTMSALSEPVPLPPPPDTVTDPESLQFPTDTPVQLIHLEDKVVSEDGGVDTRMVTRAPTRPVRGPVT